MRSRPRAARHPAGTRTSCRAVVLLASACAALGGCGDPPAPAPAPVAATTEDETPAAPSTPIFTDQAGAVGLDFTHDAGVTGEFYPCEIIGGGAGLFDYDGDGDLDAYLVQGGPLDGVGEPLRDRLFRNELVETGSLRFTDVTEQSGIDSTGYGMGLAVGDYDGNGTPDLYVTNYGPNVLYRNNGDGTFTDVTDASGAGDDRWSCAATFVDYDLDGHLDLFVGNYIDFSPETNKPCYAASSARDYCSPLSYDDLPDRLLRNRGDGIFEDATTSAGIAAAFGAALGATAADFNGDGWPDLYVANDARANQLWLNDGNGRFRDEALLAGCAYNARGQAEGSMGVDAGDFDEDGDDDLFMTHVDNETNTLYVNNGSALFDDHTTKSGLGAPSLGMTGFGTGWLDYDNDTRLDLLVVNGAVVRVEALAAAGDDHPFDQPNMLFHNAGGGRFEDVSGRAGPALGLEEVSRAAAFGDVDNDGDTDVLIGNNNGPVRLLVNEVEDAGNWAGLRLLAESEWDACGAAVVCTLPDGRRLHRRARADGSYCAANDPRVLVGLGSAERVGAIEVRWPDGQREQWEGRDIAVGDYTTLRQGSGRAVQ
jgi:hypothetical protein